MSYCKGGIKNVIKIQIKCSVLKHWKCVLDKSCHWFIPAELHFLVSTVSAMYWITVNPLNGIISPAVISEHKFWQLKVERSHMYLFYNKKVLLPRLLVVNGKTQKANNKQAA